MTDGPSSDMGADERVDEVAAVDRRTSRAVGAQPKQLRAVSTIDALVEATIKALGEVGEAGFRVEDVLQETGTSKGSLYHHFTNRDGLIEAATLVEFSRQIQEDTLAIERGEKVYLPPALVYQGTADQWTTVDLAKRLVSDYKKAGGEAELLDETAAVSWRPHRPGRAC